MKSLFSIALIFAFALGASAQTISKDKYEKAMQFAESETNSAYPVVFKVITDTFENGKPIKSETEIIENEPEERVRNKKIVTEKGKQTISYQITVGFGNNFCSDDAATWKHSEYECGGGVMIIGRPNRRKYGI